MRKFYIFLSIFTMVLICSDSYQVEAKMQCEVAPGYSLAYENDGGLSEEEVNTNMILNTGVVVQVNNYNCGIFDYGSTIEIFVLVEDIEFNYIDIGLYSQVFGLYNGYYYLIRVDDEPSRYPDETRMLTYFFNDYQVVVNTEYCNTIGYNEPNISDVSNNYIVYDYLADIVVYVENNERIYVSWFMYENLNDNNEVIIITYIPSSINFDYLIVNKQYVDSVALDGNAEINFNGYYTSNDFIHFYGDDFTNIFFIDSNSFNK